MFLLATNSRLAERCAMRIESELKESVQAASSLARARVLFRSGRFRAIILDECLLQADPPAADALLESCRGTCTIFVNMAICGIDRIVRQVRTASLHEEQLRLQAQVLAVVALKNEVKDVMTGLMLALDLACARLPSDASLLQVQKLARQLSAHLEAGKPAAEMPAPRLRRGDRRISTPA